jgi:uncharacterized membrane protein
VIKLINNWGLSIILEANYLHVLIKDVYIDILWIGYVSSHNLNQLLCLEFGEKFNIYPYCNLSLSLLIIISYIYDWLFINDELLLFLC